MSRFRLLGCALVLVLPGCGAQKASVSGTVRFKNQPLPSGTVLFHGADGRVEHSLIAADGTYTIADAPIGTVRITVQSHGAAPPALSSPVDQPRTVPPELAPRAEDRRDSSYVLIPGHYQDPEKSGLKYSVDVGAQTHDIELQP
jgi:hypothetical protein